MTNEQSEQKREPESPPTKRDLKREEQRQRKLVVETIYPALLKNARSVKDAKNIAKNFVVAMDAAFQIDVRNYSTYRSGDRLTTLDMKSIINPGKEQTTEWSWIESLKDEKISTVKGLLSGLERELQRLTDRDEKEKKLVELKTEFL